MSNSWALSLAAVSEGRSKTGTKDLRSLRSSVVKGEMVMVREVCLGVI